MEVLVGGSVKLWSVHSPGAESGGVSVAARSAPASSALDGVESCDSPMHRAVGVRRSKTSRLRLPPAGFRIPSHLAAAAKSPLSPQSNTPAHHVAQATPRKWQRVDPASLLNPAVEPEVAAADAISSNPASDCRGRPPSGAYRSPLMAQLPGARRRWSGCPTLNSGFGLHPSTGLKTFRQVRITAFVLSPLRSTCCRRSNDRTRILLI